MEKDKIAVVYATKTGHSKKIAEAIAAEFGGKADSIQTYDKTRDIGLMFLVGGIYGGQSMPEMIEFAESLSREKVGKVALITSSTAGSTKQSVIRSALTGHEIEVEAEEYVCKGNFLVFGLTHPNKEDVEGAVSFARTVAAVR